MAKRRTTTKDVALLQQLSEQGQLLIATEFQRNGVWPSQAKAYLIDTILNDKPIPPLFLQRSTSAQKGKTVYTVIDGQQRLRAIFEFIAGRYKLTQSENPRFRNRNFAALLSSDQDQILNYDFVAEELSGYSESELRDLFVRINKYVVKLSPQELRHARGQGKFAEFVERLGRLDFWKTGRVFSTLQLQRMRSVEFAAELAILLIEGPQDKKAAIDLYYGQYQKTFPEEKNVEATLKSYFEWIADALPNLSKSRFRKPVDLYSLIGALETISKDSGHLPKGKRDLAGDALMKFESDMRSKHPSRDASRYLAAASRQTDNIIPRNTRIEILEKVIRNASKM